MTSKWMVEFEIMTLLVWGMHLTQPGHAVEPGSSTFNGHSPDIFNLIHSQWFLPNSKQGQGFVVS